MIYVDPQVRIIRITNILRYAARVLSDFVLSLRKSEAFSKWFLPAVDPFGIRREKFPGLAEWLFH